MEHELNIELLELCLKADLKIKCDHCGEETLDTTEFTSRLGSENICESCQEEIEEQGSDLDKFVKTFLGEK